MKDHYFETRFKDGDGKEIPPQRYGNLQWPVPRLNWLATGS
jgi:hypothetical protein